MKKKTACPLPLYIDLYSRIISRILKPAGWSCGWIPAADLTAKPLASAEKGWKKYVLTAVKADSRLFFPLQKQGQSLITSILNKIRCAGKKKLPWQAVICADNREEMDRLRRKGNGTTFKSALYSCLTDLNSLTGDPGTEKPAVQTVQVKVQDNSPMQGKRSKQFRLKLTGKTLPEMGPAQFIMMDTRDLKNPKKISRNEKKAYLKRPFGIQRLDYPGFKENDLRRLELPPELSPAVHMPFPVSFDLTCQTHGRGTEEMSRLKNGDLLKILAPLGRSFTPVDLDTKKISEVHLLGGGVGMAPLVSFAQSLTLSNVKVKVFAGFYELADISCRIKGKKYYNYLDDLLLDGVKPAQLHIALETGNIKARVRGIPSGNLGRGFITDLYGSYLNKKNKTPAKRILLIACGPQPMMQALQKTVRGSGIDIRFLLENRMACGIGVCLSCVQKIRSPGEDFKYERVCCEGPLFQAKDIIW